mgnify:FL=1|tara:strand:- start:43 stop:240 length:198 start_codon:yes stop_codon:yes gene_type:complete
MINVIITVFMGLLFVVPLIYAIECKIRLNIEKDKCDYWRQKSIELNHKNSKKRFETQEEKFWIIK